MMEVDRMRRGIAPWSVKTIGWQAARARMGRLASPRNILLIYILVAFALGGGARADIASLALLRPLSILMLAYALLTTDRANWRANRVLLALAATWTVMVALHLVPLPPSVWHMLPGRELAAAIDAGVGLGDTWRPLSLVPYRTLNSLFSLAIPLAGLVLAISCSRRDLAECATLLVGLTLANAGLSLLQAGAGPEAPFHLFRVTNADTPVGLFANRNHSAILFALGVASLGALRVIREPPRELQRYWPMILGAAAVAIFPFVLMTQSRAGLVLAALALGAAWWIARAEPGAASVRGKVRARYSLARTLALLAAIGAVIVVAGVLLRHSALGDTAFSRLLDAPRRSEELRLAIWPASLELARAFWPIGSGIGTFVEIYEAGEPASTLGATYVNHAHNDLLELAITGGLPALGLVALSVVWLWQAGKSALLQAQGRDRALRRLGLVFLALLSLASLYDYPLRTPSLALTFILALVWIAGKSPAASQGLEASRHLSPTAGRSRRQSDTRSRPITSGGPST